ncbi:helix-turn-helix domain-containing protein [Solicola gregarius]|uniref:Helix-turn-helix transcriptional regulator n=1 Tax=Solicola gregarius TaxID=2908642 RepID=A0AA46TIE6_9ACTN|nr:helix-turn-helix transcriptional regulator [Solicola gregarius]UYM05781.1 helix-turn-helix transcriptional regulator [Solicola gregarius]
MSELGDYLRTTRDQLSPGDAGIHDTHRRRVPGLRREEVAARAGVSVDYYIRLEQGRERSPSTQTTAAIARALLLDGHNTKHLFRLAGITPAMPVPTDRGLDPDLRDLIDSLADNPIIILGNALDVVATNRLGEAMFCGFPYSRNLLESVFLAPQSPTFYRDWDQIAEYTAAAFRLLHGENPTNDRINAVMDRVASDSPRFRQIWATNLVRGRRLRRKRLLHPVVGELTVAVQAFDARSSPGLEVVVYRAATADDATKLHALHTS